MKIIDIYHKHEKPVLSLEVFPPKSHYSLDAVFRTIDDLKNLKPGFISVTYGAGGKSRDRTVEIASRIKKEYKIEAMAHLTCMVHSRQEVDHILNCLLKENITNILCLRGDPPEDTDYFHKHKREYMYAAELIKDARNKADFGVLAAAYPEGHVECRRLSDDLYFLKEKVDAGVDALITQFFFDNRKYYDFLEKTTKVGINIPIIPGIMPVLNPNQIKRMILLSGASVPGEMFQLLDKYRDDPTSMEKAGIEFASIQVQDLLETGIEGIHMYTMNKSTQIREIINNVGLNE